MIYQLEIMDDDLEWLSKSPSFTLNRWSDDDSARCRRLQNDGIIEQLEYYGESVCYNPSYRPTELGKRVIKQYKATINGNT